MNLKDSLRYFGSYVVGDIVQDTIKTYKDPISSAIGSIPVIGGYASKVFEESFLTSESDALAQALGLGTKKGSLSFDEFDAATSTGTIGGSSFRSRGLASAGRISLGNNGQVNAALNNAKVQDFLMSSSRVKIPAATIKATNTIKLPTGIPKVATKKKGLG
jgi:hypothetical protein